MSDIIINVIDREGIQHELQAPTDMSISIMELLRMTDFGVEGTCGGIAECASCHIYIHTDHQLREMSPIEDMMLDDVNYIRKENSRLGCQLGIRENMNGLKIEIAPEQ